MKRETAISRANKLGYTIQYDTSEDELRLRKPGAAMNALNQPYQYCRVYRQCASWFFEEKVEPQII